MIFAKYAGSKIPTYFSASYRHNIVVDYTITPFIMEKLLPSQQRLKKIILTNQHLTLSVESDGTQR